MQLTKEDRDLFWQINYHCQREDWRSVAEYITMGDFCLGGKGYERFRTFKLNQAMKNLPENQRREIALVFFLDVFEEKAEKIVDSSFHWWSARIISRIFGQSYQRLAQDVGGIDAREWFTLTRR